MEILKILTPETVPFPGFSSRSDRNFPHLNLIIFFYSENIYLLYENLTVSVNLMMETGQDPRLIAACTIRSTNSL